MTDVNAILAQQLAEAIAQKDRPRQVALAASMLKERGADVPRLQQVITEAASVLVQEHQQDDLEAAAQWAQTWHRHTRQAAIKELWNELQERIETLRAVEERLRAALTSSDPAMMRAAINELECETGQLKSTGPLIAEAKRKLEATQTSIRRRLTDRLAKTEVARERVMACIPGLLDQAQVQFAALLELDPTAGDDPALEHLGERLQTVHTLHGELEAALAEKAVPVLERAFQALRGSDDRISTSAMLLDAAATELGSRRELLTVQIATCAEVDLSLVDLALPAFEALLVLDPEAPELAQLVELRADQRRLLALHQRLESLARTAPGQPGLEADAAELRTSNRRLCGALELADAVASAVARWRERRHRQRVLAMRAGVALALVLAVFLPLWWRDAHLRASVLNAADDHQALTLAKAYAADWTHLFFRASMTAHAEALTRRIDEAAFMAARAPSDDSERKAALEHYLTLPEAHHLSEARLALQAAKLALEDQVIAAATAIRDPAKRIIALDAYIAGAQISERAAYARTLIAELRRVRDEAAWHAVQAAPTPTAALAALDAYLALDGQPAHHDDAQVQRQAAMATISRQRDEATDDAAWEAASRGDELRATIIHLEAYRSGTTIKRHLPAAVARLAQVRKELDDAVWRGVISAADPLARSDLLRRYLAGDTQRTHAGEAQGALQEALWAAASAPGTVAERLARVHVYLGDAGNQAHRAEAVKAEQALLSSLDKEHWEAARAVADVPGRVRAISAYLDSPGAHAFSISAGEVMARSLEEATTLPAATLAQLPGNALAALSTAQLERLSPEALAVLPAGLQARVALHPGWSSAAGVDPAGRWADLVLGKHTLRFRFIFPGQVRIISGAGTLAIGNAGGFWLGEAECPQSLWVEMLGGFFSSHNPSAHRGDQLPVDSVTFGECRDFTASCNRLLAKQGSGAQLRLPSGAEWRFAAVTASEGAAGLDRGACRAPTPDELAALAWANENSGGKPRACDAGARDHWGLLNLLGNVAEWCSDSDGLAIIHGGAWNLPLAECVAARAVAAPSETRSDAVGLRLVVENAATATTPSATR
jgi:sulfatase modifying factor 1